MSAQHQTFEDLKQSSEDGQEIWSARELALVLEYRDWRNFQKVIQKAMLACEGSGQAVQDHFVDAAKMVSLGSGPQGKQQANQTHYEVGQKVRQTITELGGTMPEDLPAPEQSIKQVESAAKQLGDKHNQESNQ